MTCLTSQKKSSICGVILSSTWSFQVFFSITTHAPFLDINSQSTAPGEAIVRKGESVSNQEILDAFRPWRLVHPSSHATNTLFLEKYLPKMLSNIRPIEELNEESRTTWQRVVKAAEARLRYLIKKDRKHQDIDGEKVGVRFSIPEKTFFSS